MELYKIVYLFEKTDIGRIENAKMPFLAARQLWRLLRELGEIYNDFLKAKRNLLETYGEKDGDQLHITPESPNWNAFMKEYVELLNTDVEVKSAPVEAKYFENLELSPQEYQALAGLVFAEE